MTSSGLSWILSFQSTPPRGGRLVSVSIVVPAAYFNPRPREGGDYHPILRAQSIVISIHAPARGATLTSSGLSWILSFQSTPPRGGRLVSVSIVVPAAYFNPRPREGGDYHPILRAQSIVISIHAPARGATMQIPMALTCKPNFNPRPREGGDVTEEDAVGDQWLFQSTPPRGGRPADGQVWAMICVFQSTPPRGGRHRTYT